MNDITIKVAPPLDKVHPKQIAAMAEEAVKNAYKQIGWHHAFTTWPVRLGGVEKTIIGIVSAGEVRLFLEEQIDSIVAGPGVEEIRRVIKEGKK